MRKLLILLILLSPLPVLADSATDALGGPSATNTTQTQTDSPQQEGVQSNILQPNSTSSSAQAQNTSLQLLQGDTPTDAQKLIVEGDGQPESLSTTSTSSWIELGGITIVALIIMAGAVWWWYQLGRQPQE